MSLENYFSGRTLSTRLANWVSVALAVSSVLFCAIGISRSYSPVPLPDDWIGIYEFALDAYDGDIQAWWRPTLENRPVVPRMFFWLDVMQFDGAQFFLVAINILVAISVWLMLLIFIRHRIDRTNMFFVSCISLAAMFAWMQGTNLYSGWAGSVWFMAMLLPLAAFYCLYRSINNNLWFALSATLGVASVWTWAIGILVFPALILSSSVIGLGWRRTAVLLALFLLCAVIYFSNLSLPPRLGYQPATAALFTFTFLGGPVFWSVVSWIAGLGHLSAVIAGEKSALSIDNTFQNFPAAVEIGQILATVSGVVFVIVMIVSIWREARSARPDLLNRCLLGFIVYLLLSAMAIAVGRVHSGIGHLNEENYQTATLVAWLALLIASVRPIFSLRTAAVIAIATFLVVLPSELRALKSYQADRQRQITALRAVENGNASQEQIATLGGPGVVPIVNRLKNIGIRLVGDDNAKLEGKGPAAKQPAN
jgi:hypothetical protein